MIGGRQEELLTLYRRLAPVALRAIVEGQLEGIGPNVRAAAIKFVALDTTNRTAVDIFAPGSKLAEDLGVVLSQHGYNTYKGTLMGLESCIGTSVAAPPHIGSSLDTLMEKIRAVVVDEVVVPPKRGRPRKAVVPPKRGQPRKAVAKSDDDDEVQPVRLQENHQWSGQGMSRAVNEYVAEHYQGWVEQWPHLFSLKRPSEYTYTSRGSITNMSLNEMSARCRALEVAPNKQQFSRLSKLDPMLTGMLFWIRGLNSKQLPKRLIHHRLWWASLPRNKKFIIMMSLPFDDIVGGPSSTQQG